VERKKYIFLYVYIQTERDEDNEEKPAKLSMHFITILQNSIYAHIVPFGDFDFVGYLLLHGRSDCCLEIINMFQELFIDRVRGGRSRR
jgi:hypothetical protein